MPEPTSAPLRIAVVDDEPLARAVLCEFLAAEPNVDVVAQCANGFEAVKAVSELAPDLLLLDVQMPKLDGFEVLDLVGRDVAVVFTTAYDQYALRAFEVHAVDYLLKPISAERLSEALARVRDRLGRGERAASPGAMAAAKPREGHAHRVLVRDGPRVHVIPVDKIDYVQAQDDYVCFRSEGKDYLKEQTLAETEASLNPAVFVRIHRSYLLNLARLVRVDHGRAGEPRGGAHRRPPATRQPRRLHAAQLAALALLLKEPLVLHCAVLGRHFHVLRDIVNACLRILLEGNDHRHSVLGNFATRRSKLLACVRERGF